MKCSLVLAVLAAPALADHMPGTVDTTEVLYQAQGWKLELRHEGETCDLYTIDPSSGQRLVITDDMNSTVAVAVIGFDYTGRSSMNIMVDQSLMSLAVGNGSEFGMSSYVESNGIWPQFRELLASGLTAELLVQDGVGASWSLVGSRAALGAFDECMRYGS